MAVAARLTLLTSIAVAMLILVAGCGGDDDSSVENGSSQVTGSSNGDGSTGNDDSSDDGGGGPTKAEFLKRANATCLRKAQGMTDEFSAYLKRPQNSGKSQEEIFAGMIKTVLLPVIEEQLTALRKLQPPPDDEAQVNAFIQAQQNGVEAMAKLKSLPEGPAGEKYLEPATRLAKAYGINACAQS